MWDSYWRRQALPSAWVIYGSFRKGGGLRRRRVYSLLHDYRRSDWVSGNAGRIINWKEDAEKCDRAFRQLDKRFSLWGGIGVLTLFVIMSYYSIVGGWVLKYIWVYVSGAHFGTG